jgi:protochlorophyllide reductase
MRGLAAAAAGDARGWDMVDGGRFDGDKAYKDSKLCNVLFAREAQRRLAARGGRAACNAFSPGLITESGLFRNQNPVFTAVFGLAVNRLARVGESVPFGGDCLARMVAGPELDGRGGLFFSNSRPGQHTFEEVPVSVEAADAARGRRLWELSAAAVGLAPADALPEPAAVPAA